MLLSGICFLGGTLGFIIGILIVLWGLITLNMETIGVGLASSVVGIVVFFIGTAFRSMGGQELFPFNVFKMKGTLKDKIVAFFEGLLGETFYILMVLIIIAVILFFGWLTLLIMGGIFALMVFLLKKRIKSEPKLYFISGLVAVIIGLIIFSTFLIGASLESSGYNSLNVLKRTIGLVGKPQQIDTLTNITYNNDEYGFQLTYPSNWFEDYAQRQNVILDLKAPEMLGTLTIKKYDNANHLTQQELFDYQFSEEYKQYLDQTGAISSLKIEKDFIDGIPVAKSTYIETSTLVGNTYVSKVITINIIKDENTLIGINYGSSPEKFDINLEEAEQIIHSFNFI